MAYFKQQFRKAFLLAVLAAVFIVLHNTASSALGIDEAVFFILAMVFIFGLAFLIISNLLIMIKIIARIIFLKLKALFLNGKR